MAHQSPRYRECVDACNACAAACWHCANACLGESDPKAMARCIALDMDCAGLCQFTAGAMARDSELATHVARLCEQACSACAEECARHPHRHCQDCAAACRRCAEACRAVVERVSR